MRQTITVPPRADPFVKELYRLCLVEGQTVKRLAERSGVSGKTITGWRQRSSPKACDLEACFNAIGYRLVVQPINDGREEDL